MSLSLMNWLKAEKLVPTKQEVFQMPESSRSAIKGGGNIPSAENAGPSATQGILAGIGGLGDQMKKYNEEKEIADAMEGPQLPADQQPSFWEKNKFSDTILGKYLWK